MSGKKEKTQKQNIRSGLETFNLPKSNFSDWYDAIMDAAEIVDRRYPVKGAPVLRPYGFFMHNAIMRKIEDDYAEQGIQQSLFPTLIPRSFLAKEAEHIKGFESECYWCDRGGLDALEEPLALRPTSETAIYSMFALWTRSFRDLPLKIHQTCSVFRFETKNTRPLIRVREIPWNEAHTAHATREEALAQMKIYWEVYLSVFEAMGFYGQKLVRAPWDKFAGAEHTEVLDVVMPCGKVLQTAGIHFLGQKFAKVFNIKFIDQNNTQQFAEMTCAGISTRALACALSVHGDQKGLMLPSLIAMYQVVLVPCGKYGDDLVLKMKEIQQTLKAAGIRSFFDDSKKSMGEKIFHWEMKGVPLRIELGPRDLESGDFVAICRDTGKDGKQVFKVQDIAAVARDQLAQYDSRLRAAGRAFATERCATCRTLAEAQAAVPSGFARVPLAELEQSLEEAFKKLVVGAEIRGYDPEAACEGELCVVTGAPAKFWCFVARAY
ncbi:Prolyl-tRNA synthetase [Spironucleus salmonicida]|uniref:proline--tRNA ligase n=2 Tax=Spironucleus TaxID=39709 RepID=V6LND7_9EUKA|nr:Prolyl-tRNA synthetase [Spironucleus salmonicida]KAH0576064.1 Prolyl-tRNA synthetase [Spironucleus salmonicida]|eukprot:EST46145.1 Prolyl-tRNA synthetase [Spironucleus salmonicida]